MEHAVLKTKFYDVKLEEEKAFIKRLRKALFPKAKQKKYWEIVKEWYSWTIPCSPEVRIEDAMEKTTFGKVSTEEFKEIISAFDNRVTHFNSHDYTAASFRMALDFRFLFDETLEPFRLLKMYFEKLQEIKRKDAKDHHSRSYTWKEISDRLELKNDDEFRKMVYTMCEIGLLSCSGYSLESKDKMGDASFSFGIKSTETLAEWYEGFLRTIDYMLVHNRKEFFKSIPIVGYFFRDKQETYQDTSGLLAETGASFQPKSSLKNFLFLLFFVLVVAAVICFLNSNIVLCIAVTGWAITILVTAINQH